MSRIKTNAAPKSVVSGTDTGLKIGSGGISKIDDLSDVEIGADPVKDNSLLKWDATNNLWKPDTTFYASKAFVDSQIDALTTGLSHGVSVLSIKNDPPATAQAGNYFIVGTAPTGAWAGHANSVAHWTVHLVPGEADAFRWQFEVPRQGETHLVEDQDANWHWNGTSWVKVASTAGGVETSFSAVHQDPAASTAGVTFTIDLGRDNWTRAEIAGTLEVAGAPTHLTFMPKTKMNVESLSQSMCHDFYCQLRYGNAYEVKSTNLAQWFIGNNIGLTWLPQVNGSNDRISATTFNKTDLRIEIQLMANRTIHITTHFCYWSYGGTSYIQQLNYKFNVLPTDKNIQKITFIPSDPGAKIWFNGRSTVY